MTCQVEKTGLCDSLSSTSQVQKTSSANKFFLLVLCSAVIMNIIAIVLLEFLVYRQQWADTPINYRHVVGKYILILAFGCCFLFSFLHARTRKWNFFLKQPISFFISTIALLFFATFLEVVLFIFSMYVVDLFRFFW